MAVLKLQAVSTWLIIPASTLILAVMLEFMNAYIYYTNAMMLNSIIIIANFFCTVGSDGHSYMFLLKGHEDLRQDERVMQLFGLVNTLLDNDPETFKRHLR